MRLAVGDGIVRHKHKDDLVTPRPPAEQAIYADLVTEVTRLLGEGRLPDIRRRGDRHRPIRPPDIAVLVGRHSEAADVQAALAEHGDPGRRGPRRQRAGVAGRRPDAVAPPRPRPTGRPPTGADVRAVMVRRLAAPPTWPPCRRPTWWPCRRQLRQWSEMLGSHSVADTFARVWSESGVVPEVLAAADGDRNMTDLDHLVELFAGVSAGGRSGVAGLLSLLDTEPRHEDDTEVDGDVSARRIASEAASVQIMTVWAAKGLEFPVVCLPTLWRPPRQDEPVVYVDPDHGSTDLRPGRRSGLARRGRGPGPAAAGRRRSRPASACASCTWR